MTREQRIAELKKDLNFAKNESSTYFCGFKNCFSKSQIIIEELQAENEKLKEKLETAKSHIMEAKYYLDQNGLDEKDKKNGLNFIDEAINLLNNNQNNNE